MSNDDTYDKQAAELLPCVPTTNCRTVEGKQRHGTACPAYWRPGLAAKLREQYIAGLEAARNDIMRSAEHWVYYRIKALIDAKKGEK